MHVKISSISTVDHNFAPNNSQKVVIQEL